MSKTALNMGMQEFAIKLRDKGAHVLLLHPGWVQTAMGGPQAIVPPKKALQACSKSSKIKTSSLREASMTTRANPSPSRLALDVLHPQKRSIFYFSIRT